jgi:hypothetical protein
MITTVEGLKTSYIYTNNVMTFLRNMGVSVANKSSIVKSIFMTAASGEVFHPTKYAWE